MCWKQVHLPPQLAAVHCTLCMYWLCQRAGCGGRHWQHTKWLGLGDWLWRGGGLWRRQWFGLGITSDSVCLHLVLKKYEDTADNAKYFLCFCGCFVSGFLKRLGIICKSCSENLQAFFRNLDVFATTWTHEASVKTFRCEGIPYHTVLAEEHDSCHGILRPL